MKAREWINIISTVLMAILFSTALIQQFGSVTGYSAYVGNPIHAGTGNKFQVVKDFSSPSGGSSFTRYYNSLDDKDIGLGVGWRHSYSMSLDVNSTTTIYAYRADGKVYTFTKDASGNWITDPDTPVTLTQTATGWVYQQGEHSEQYDAKGLLASISDKNGINVTLTYDAGQLLKVTDRFSRDIVITHDVNNKLATVTFAGTESVTYSYDANANLVKALFNDGTSKQYLYEDTRFPNALTGRVDENGNQVSNYEYDDQGRGILTEKTGGVNRYTLVYNTDGTTTVTDPSGAARIYHFETLHGVTKVVSIEGGPCTSCSADTTAATYDSNGFVASKTDYNGNVTTYINNAVGLQTSRTEAVGTPQERTISTTWNTATRRPLKITELGKITDFSYDTNGNLLQRTETDTTNNKTRSVNYTYNALGQMLSIDEARTDVNDVTQFTYDTQGNLQQVENALGHVTKVTSHDAAGRPLLIVDANGQETTLTYDARGRLTSRSIGGLVTTFDYDAVGNLKTISLPDLRLLTYGYDLAKRLISVQDQLGNKITYTLDNAGNRIKEDVTDQAGVLTRTRQNTYNELNQLVNMIGAQSQQTSFGYDGNGNRITVTDAATKTMTYAFDALNRVISVTDPLTGQATYGYDVQGNLASVKDANGSITSYGYDGFNNRVSQTSQDTGTTTYTYDEVGNVLTQTDAKIQTTAYQYDALNRLILTTYADGTTDAYSYVQGTNQVGRLTGITTTSVANGVSSLSYSYDLFGRLLSKTHTVNGISLITAYSYNALGQLSSMTYPSGAVIEYAYSNGQLTEMQVNGEILINSIKYDPFGPINGWIWGNGSVHSRGYDLDGQLISQSMAGEVRNLGYDVKGNITSIQNTSNSINQVFDYDELNRLVAANDVSFNQAFSYDANGNRLSITDAAVVDTYQYDATNINRLSSISGSTPKTYQYDANGNTIHDGLHSYVYDARNRLVNIDGAAATYQHNALGQRVQKDASGTITIFYYDEQGQLIAEADNTGFVYKEYIYLGNQPIAVRNLKQVNISVDKVLDNTDASVLLLGNWKSSTSVAGFEGVNYSAIAPNGMPASSTIIDNGTAGFSTTGTWKVSTSVAGFEGANYQHHYANGASPESNVIDNSSGIAVGTWPVSTSVPGYEATNYQHHSAGTGLNSFRWEAGVANAGDYNVYAKWTSHANRASNATYTVTHTAGNTPVTVNQQSQGGEWVLLGQFALDANSQITLNDNANGYVIADGIMIEPFGAEPNTARWSIAPTTAGNYTVYAKWTEHSNRASDMTYVVEHVDGVTPVTQNQQTNGAQWVSLGNYNLDANSAVILTDQANGYVIADAVAIVPVNAAPNQAIWQINVGKGNYDLYAKWTAHANRASNAPFSISDINGQTPLIVNQQINGGQWNLLGNFSFDAASTVSLNDKANGYVIADALRVVGNSTKIVESLNYIHTDHLGTPRVITDANNTTIWLWQSDPFGKTSANEDPDNNGINFTFNLRFPGQYYDVETGLHYNYFRDYDPSTGRYVQSDPIGLAGGLNTYGYVGMNPLNYVDPFGLAWFKPDNHDYTVGRPGSKLVPSGPGTIGADLDVYGPAWHTTGYYHDALVDYGTSIGIHDYLINLPTIPFVYVFSVGVEIGNSVLGLFGYKGLEHEPEPAQCK